MDEGDNIISMHEWKREKDLEKEFLSDEDASEFSHLPIMLASAYARGIHDGKIQKWMEIRLHILSLILSNLVAIAVIFWLLSQRR
jgi:undecaprenyl pyrophosphate phosphatase UppP